MRRSHHPDWTLSVTWKVQSHCPLGPEEQSYSYWTKYEMPLDTIKCKLLLKRRLNTFWKNAHAKNYRFIYCFYYPSLYSFEEPNFQSVCLYLFIHFHFMIQIKINNQKFCWKYRSKWIIKRNSFRVGLTYCFFGLNFKRNPLSPYVIC